MTEENVLPSPSSNYSLAIETYQTNFKPIHEKENNFAKFKKNVATKSSNLAKHQIFYFIRNWKSIHSKEMASVILTMIVDTEIFNNKNGKSYAYANFN